MAVNLLGSGNALVALPNVTTLGGLTEFAWCITVNISALANGERIVGQWGSAGRSFLVTIQDNDELGFTVAGSDASANFFGVKTTATNFTSGLYRLGGRWRAQAGTDDCEIWANGSLLTTTAWFSGTLASMQSVTDDIEIGHEVESVIDGVDGDYSEFAAWGSYLTSDIMQALTKGFSPGFYDANRLHYVKMINTGSLVDLDGNSSPTNSSGTTAAHPSMFYPAPPFVGKAITSGATTLTAAAGSYTITGNAATLIRSHIMAAEAGSYSLTGQTAGTAKGYRTTADAGSYAITGNAATLLRDHVMPAVAGSYAYTGNAATLTASGGTDTGFVIAGSGASDAGFGSVAWTNPANIDTDDGTYATASATNQSTEYLKSSGHGFSIPAGSTIDGIEVRIQGGADGTSAFERVRLVKAGAVQTGDRAAGSLTTSLSLNHDFGGASDLWDDTWSVSDINDSGFGAAFAITTTGTSFNAIDAIWIKVYYTESLNRVVAESGVYAISGQTAGTAWNHILTAAQGSYTLTGNAAGTLWHHVLAAEAGSYTLTGNASGTLWDHSLAAAQGIYSLTGNDINTLSGLSLTAAAGSYAITGNAAATSRGYVLAALSGAYEITGNAALFDAPIWQNLPANPGETWTDSSSGSSESWYSATPGPGETWSEE